MAAATDLPDTTQSCTVESCTTRVVPYNVVPHNVVLHNVVPHDVVPHNVVPHNIVPHNVVPHNVLPHNILLYKAPHETRQKVVRRNTVRFQQQAQHSTLHRANYTQQTTNGSQFIKNHWCAIYWMLCALCVVLQCPNMFFLSAIPQFCNNAIHKIH